MRRRTACVSGSPKRTLYSRTYGFRPFSRMMPTKRTPRNGPPFLGHALERRLDDEREDVGRRGGVQEDRRAVRAHAARVRAALAVVDLLVVLRGRERERALAVAEDHEADFLALDEPLDEDAVARRPEDAVLEEELERLLGLRRLLRDDDALARREAVRLEDDTAGRTPSAPSRPRARVRDRSRRPAVGIAVLLHESFEKTLEPSSSAASRFGPNASEPAVLELVHEPERERQLGAHDGEVDLHRLGEVGQLDDVLDADRDAGRELRDARVARRAEDVRDARRLGELPDECVLAPARTDDEKSSCARLESYRGAP